MLAVALNGDNRLTVVGRDVAGGNMTRILASLDIDAGGSGLGMVTCAVWDEDDQNHASKREFVSSDQCEYCKIIADTCASNSN